MEEEYCMIDKWAASNQEIFQSVKVVPTVDSKGERTQKRFRVEDTLDKLHLVLNLKDNWISSELLIGRPKLKRYLKNKKEFMVHILTKNNQIKIIDFPRAVKLYFKRFGLHESPFAFPFDQLLHVPEHPMQTNP